MAVNGCKSDGTSVNGCKWMEIALIAVNGCTMPKMAGNKWKGLKMAGMTRNG